MKDNLLVDVDKVDFETPLKKLRLIDNARVNGVEWAVFYISGKGTPAIQFKSGFRLFWNPRGEGDSYIEFYNDKTITAQGRRFYSMYAVTIDVARLHMQGGIKAEASRIKAAFKERRLYDGQSIALESQRVIWR